MLQKCDHLFACVLLWEDIVVFDEIVLGL